jgi:hypothetical protein
VIKFGSILINNRSNEIVQKREGGRWGDGEIGRRGDGERGRVKSEPCNNPEKYLLCFYSHLSAGIYFIYLVTDTRFLQGLLF